MSQMDRFKDTGKELQSSLKDKATSMQRNFCVLTLEALYNSTTSKWSSKFTNHRVLVGPKEAVDACKAGIEEKMGTKDGDRKDWTFEFNE